MHNRRSKRKYEQRPQATYKFADATELGGNKPVLQRQSAISGRVFVAIGYALEQGSSTC